jgi:hypothetical protein
MPPKFPLGSKRPVPISIFSVSPLAASLKPRAPTKSISAPENVAPPSIAPQAATWRRRLLRHAVPAVAAVGLVGGVLAATHHRAETAKPVTRRAFAAPGVKETDSGSAVRWRQDALDVLIDKSFSDLAGTGVYWAAVDAWRATGAVLPSISTSQAGDRKVGYDPDGKNENVVVYAPYGWSRAKGALAITVLTFDDMSGRIVDGDVLLNGGGRFFATFDHDESDQSGSGVSIEGANDSADSDANTTSGHTPRFDVQNVLTHELGHFFGLGEDYSDDRATMYASTRPGETNKRVVSTADGSVVTALYAESPDGASSSLVKGGCGGAKVARGNSPTGPALTGFAAATAGLLLLAASRRNRAARLAVARARRPSRSGLARFGGWLTVAGTFAVLSPPELAAAPADQATRGDAEVEVTSAQPRWSEGIVETELRLRVTTCHVASCPTEEQKVVAFGGRLGKLTQVVGPYAVPQVGARASVRLHDARGFLQSFRPNLQLRP